MAALGALSLASCEKVSPSGVLIGNTSVDDRVQMSLTYYQEHQNEYVSYFVNEDEGYSFVVGSDSHLQKDDGRLREMFQSSLDNKDLIVAHCGDIADTTADNYSRLSKLYDEFNLKWLQQWYDYDAAKDTYYSRDPSGENKQEEVDPIELLQHMFPLYSCVGNHDITRNGWALFSNMFHASFFQVLVGVGGKDTKVFDRLIFLDSANGTLGNFQVEALENDALDWEKYGYKTRNVFVFTHSNIFRPRSEEFSATYPREETYYLLDRFAKWQADIVFLGHVHRYDDRVFGGIRYITLDAMSEENSPNPGEYLVRVHVKPDGSYNYERVNMNYSPKKK